MQTSRVFTNTEEIVSSLRQILGIGNKPIKPIKSIKPIL
jgi:hypothetical protein